MKQSDNYLVINLCPLWDDDKQEFFGNCPTLDEAKEKVLDLWADNVACRIYHIQANRAVAVIAWQRPDEYSEWAWVTTPILK